MSVRRTSCLVVVMGLASGAVRSAPPDDKVNERGPVRARSTAIDRHGNTDAVTPLAFVGEGKVLLSIGFPPEPSYLALSPVWDEGTYMIAIPIDLESKRRQSPDFDVAEWTRPEAPLQGELTLNFDQPVNNLTVELITEDGDSYVETFPVFPVEGPPAERFSIGRAFVQFMETGTYPRLPPMDNASADSGWGAVAGEDDGTQISGPTCTCSNPNNGCNISLTCPENAVDAVYDCRKCESYCVFPAS